MLVKRRRKEETLKAVAKKFEYWRAHRDKRGPTPPELLADIHALSKSHNLCRLARALRVNYWTVQKAAIGEGKRAEGRRGSEVGRKGVSPSFVEIPVTPLSPELSRMATIEFETPWGTKARVMTGHDPAGRIDGWLRLLLMARR